MHFITVAVTVILGTVYKMCFTVTVARDVRLNRKGTQFMNRYLL